MERLLSRKNETEQRYDFMNRAAVRLGERALRMIKGDVRMYKKPDGTKVTDVDLDLNDLFIEMTAQDYPEDLVWGEEASNSTKGDLEQAAKRWMWTIDPIDGTSGFWRCYQAGNIKDATATILLAGFAPDETTPTIGTLYNPFQERTMQLSAGPDGTFYKSSAMAKPIRVSLDGDGPTSLDRVRRYERTTWSGAKHDLRKADDLLPRAREINHQLFMGAVALGDSDLSAFPGPSNPHDIAPGALAVHNAGGTVSSLAGEPFETIDWRLPVDGVVCTATPELSVEFLETFAKRCAV